MIYVVFDTNMVRVNENGNERMYYFQTPPHFRSVCHAHKNNKEVSIIFSEVVKEEMIRDQMNRLRKMINTLRNFRAYLPADKEDEVIVKIGVKNTINLMHGKKGLQRKKSFTKSVRKPSKKHIAQC